MGYPARIDERFFRKKFKHKTWFKEGVTVGFALDYFAKTSDFYLNSKPSRKQATNLLSDVIYDDIITDGKCFYRVSEEEKRYYLERKEYWEQQRKLKHEKWLNAKIDKEKELESYLRSNSNYDIKFAEKELNHAKEDNDKERISYWEKEVKLIQKKRIFIDDFISKFYGKVITNKDFVEFEKKLTAGLEILSC